MRSGVDAETRRLAEVAMAAGQAVRRLRNDAVPLAEVGPDPLADALALRALEVEADANVLIGLGVDEGLWLALRASGLESATRTIRRARYDWG